MTPRESNLPAYFARELETVRPFRGQLTPEFQAALASYHENVTEPDCDFYHTTELPGGRVIAGAWDLRGHEGAYLGGVSLSGRRVLEYGPASGFMSRAISQAGADLTVFDLPLGRGPEIMPFAGADLAAVAASGSRSAGRLRNSWWYTKRECGFAARAVYADIYQQPDDLGRYDVAIFACILVHLSNPFLALREAAAVTRRTMIVTDMLGIPDAGERRGMMRIGGSPPPRGHVHWWDFSASALRMMLERLGFTEQTVTFHTPPSMANRPPMVTVVAHRP